LIVESANEKEPMAQFSKDRTRQRQRALSTGRQDGGCVVVWEGKKDFGEERLKVKGLRLKVKG
jgi:hypothetical protein